MWSRRRYFHEYKLLLWFSNQPNRAKWKMPFSLCGRLDKRYLLAMVRSEIYRAVSLPPALLCYDTSNIWSALYVLKHPVFHRKKLPINTEGSCGLKACEGGLWPTQDFKESRNISPSLIVLSVMYICWHLQKQKHGYHFRHVLSQKTARYCYFICSCLGCM